MDFYLQQLLCVVRWRSVWWADPESRGALTNGVCVCVSLRAIRRTTASTPTMSRCKEVKTKKETKKKERKIQIRVKLLLPGWKEKIQNISTIIRVQRIVMYQFVILGLTMLCCGNCEGCRSVLFTLAEVISAPRNRFVFCTIQNFIRSSCYEWIEFFLAKIKFVEHLAIFLCVKHIVIRHSEKFIYFELTGWMWSECYQWKLNF